jgi:hypothetical protein
MRGRSHLILVIVSADFAMTVGNTLRQYPQAIYIGNTFNTS